MLFITFHNMSSVQMHMDRSEALMGAYGATSNNLRHAAASLSPLVTRAYALLDQPGQHPLYGPIPALLELSNALRDDQRDLSWRRELIRSNDRLSLGPYSRLQSLLPLSLGAAATYERRRAAQQAELARRLFDKGVRPSANPAAEADKADEGARASHLIALNKAIGNRKRAVDLSLEINNWQGERDQQYASKVRELHAAALAARPAHALDRAHSGTDVRARLSQVVPRPSPATSEVVVQPGDTLSAIARDAGVSLEELLAANPQHRANPDLIHPGDVVTIPAGDAAAAGAATPTSTAAAAVAATKHSAAPSGSASPATQPHPATARSLIVTLNTNVFPVLSWGDGGAAVGHLQQALNVLIDAGLVVDGDFGPATNEAVRQYQAANGLVVDGIVGPNTWEHIRADLEAGGHTGIPVSYTHLTLPTNREV